MCFSKPFEKLCFHHRVLEKKNYHLSKIFFYKNVRVNIKAMYMFIKIIVKIGVRKN